MKVLQVNCVYNTGSTGKIMADIHAGLWQRGIESVVCYGRGGKVEEPHVYKTCGELYSKLNNLMTRFTGVMYGGCWFSTNKLISIIKKERPDIVHLHCINGYFVNIYRLVRWLKENHIKTVLTLHAEFMYTANCGYAMECERWKTGCGNCPRRRQETKSLFRDGTAESWRRMYQAFEGFEQDCVIVSVSPWLMERAKSSPILEKFHHETILNGLDTENAFYPRDGQALRKKLGMEGKKIVLHVTPSFSLDPTHIKGGWYVVELAKRMPEIVFLIVGNRSPIDGLPENVIDIGRVENQNELAEYYSAADVTLLTSKKETFSMVTAESLCCGTPVVGFKAGAPEQIAIPKFSAFVDFGDLFAAKKVVENCVTENVEVDRLVAQAKKNYAGESMCKAYLKLYEETVNTERCCCSEYCD